MPQARRKPPPGTEQTKEEPQEESLPEAEPRVRTAKFKKMESSVVGFYRILGGALSVMPPQMAGPKVRKVGKAFAHHSDTIAEAWIDLAEDDAYVRRVIESMTGFSTWGKVVASHLEAIGEDEEIIPGISAIRAMQGQQEQPVSDDMQAAMALAQFMAESAAAQRAGNGEAEQPQEAVRRTMPPQRPQRQQQQQPVAQPQHPMGQGPGGQQQQGQAPPMGQTRRPVGMPTPADLGVEVPDSPEDFPAGGSQDVRG